MGEGSIIIWLFVLAVELWALGYFGGNWQANRNMRNYDQPQAAPPVLATGGEDAAVRIRDPLTGDMLGTLVGHQAAVQALDFGRMHDGRLLLASGSDDTTVRIWDGATSEAIGDPLQGHRTRVRSVAFAFKYGPA